MRGINDGMKPKTIVTAAPMPLFCWSSSHLRLRRYMGMQMKSAVTQIRARHVQAGDEDAAAAVVSAAELSGRRPDGMRGFTAPLLRGEGAWPDMHPNSRFPIRIFYCLDALLADIPFWFEVCRFPGILSPSDSWSALQSSSLNTPTHPAFL